MLEESIEWIPWASRLNQLSLLPFLAFLWTLWHTPSAPRKAVQGWTFYLAFIAVAIPAGIYCRQQLGTSMANVDWVHGPCEALLTTANLLIVLGLRDALRNTPPSPPPPPSNDTSSPSKGNSAMTGGSSTTTTPGTIQDSSLKQQHQQQQRCAAPSGHGLRVEAGPWANEQCSRNPNQPHSICGPAVEGPKAAEHHQLPGLEHKQHRRGPGVLKVQVQQHTRTCCVIRPTRCRAARAVCHQCASAAAALP